MVSGGDKVVIGLLAALGFAIYNSLLLKYLFPMLNLSLPAIFTTAIEFLLLSIPFYFIARGGGDVIIGLFSYMLYYVARQPLINPTLCLLDLLIYSAAFAIYVGGVAYGNTIKEPEGLGIMVTLLAFSTSLFLIYLYGKVAVDKVCVDILTEPLLGG